VVSFAGSIPEIYEVAADPELQEMLLDCEYNFWQMVIQRIPPEPVSYSDMLSRFGGKSIPNSVAATDDALEAWSELKKIKAASKRLETEEAAARAVIMKLLGENDTLVGISGRPLVTWKKSKDSTVFDEERFKAACPKTYSRFQKTKTGSRRFLLKEEK
jgi:predicted phage-related endonuclease